MIEVYLFLAVFPVQILALSVLYPVRFTRLIRTALAKVPAERLTELYPGVDVGQAHERFLARYRLANAVVAVLGLLLLAWFLRYMQDAGWDTGTVGGLITAYFVLQYLPLALIAWLTPGSTRCIGARRWEGSARQSFNAVGCSISSRRSLLSLRS